MNFLFVLLLAFPVIALSSPWPERKHGWRKGLAFRKPNQRLFGFRKFSPFFRRRAADRRRQFDIEKMLRMILTAFKNGQLLTPEATANTTTESPTTTQTMETTMPPTSQKPNTTGHPKINAQNAINAKNAVYAINAYNAMNAGNAYNAQNAMNSYLARSAHNAEFANNAINALNAKNAINAEYAKHLVKNHTKTEMELNGKMTDDIKNMSEKLENAKEHFESLSKHHQKHNYVIEAHKTEILNSLVSNEKVVISHPVGMRIEVENGEIEITDNGKIPPEVGLLKKDVINATDAVNSVNSLNAENAMKAHNAKNSYNARNARNAQNAMFAPNAENAKYAKNAINAKYAEYAVHAKHVINDTMTMGNEENMTEEITLLEK